jgi:type IV pilus assembly protein PilO
MAGSRDVLSQFQNLSLENVGSWPLAPKVAVWLFVVVACATAGWFLLWSNQVGELDRLRQEEDSLKTQFKQKLQQAVNLEELRRQKEQVSQYVLTLEKQLPSKAEMDALLSDINQAGIGRGLQFELFRPGQNVIKDYYAELPIAIKVSGRYHDLGAFVSDIANLPRIVTLNNVSIQSAKDGGLSMDATAKTFRYLDEEELAARRQEQQAASKKK